MKKSDNDLQEMVTHAINEMEQEAGHKLDPDEVNLAELGRRTGLSRHKLRRLKTQSFVVKPHGNTGRKAVVTVLTGYTGVIDELLRHNVTNSEVIYERISELGYTGGKSSVKNYISDHSDLIPAKRQIVSPQGNRGRRYETGPGES